MCSSSKSRVESRRGGSKWPTTQGLGKPFKECLAETVNYWFRKVCANLIKNAPGTKGFKQKDEVTEMAALGNEQPNKMLTR